MCGWSRRGCARVLTACDAEEHFQFERLGYFVVDKDSYATGPGGAPGPIVFNRTCGLREAKAVKAVKSGGAAHA